MNELEYLNWAIGQPYNISISIAIRGNLQENILMNALDKVQKKHPMLNCQLFLDDNNHPFLVWGNTGKIPIEVIPRTEDDQYKKIVENEFITPFETGINCPIPLIRIKQLYSEFKSDLIITMQHVIADGMSMVYLLRDIFDFIIEPGKKIESFELVKEIENILPYSYQKKIPQTPRKFNRTLWFLRRVIKLYRFKQKLGKKHTIKTDLIIENFENKKFMTRSWTLTEDQTQKLIKKCKFNDITVHSALCTLFLSDFPIINNPVNLRNRLAYQVGESVGLYASGLVIKKKYKKKQTFWKNAKLYHKKLIKNLESDKVFKFLKLLSRAVPLESIKEIGPIFLELASKSKPFGLTNLGIIDKINISQTSENFIIENLYGGVSTTLNAIVVAVFTIENKIHFHLHYYKPPHSEEEIEKYLFNAQEKLNIALKN